MRGVRTVWTAAAVAASLAGCASYDDRRLAAVEASTPEPKVVLAAPGGTVGDLLHCLDGRAALISGHRGGVEPGYPENALETMANTLARGPMLLEIDVRETADGVLVLMHDEDLDRTTTGSGPIADATWAEVRELKLIDNGGTVTAFAPPSLDQALSWAQGRAMLQLDVKRAVDIADVVALVAARGAQDRAAVIAYTLEDALSAARTDPTVSISVEITDAERLAALRDAGVDTRRLMAWTGVAEEPRPELWTMLSGEDMLIAFGALWYMDKDVEETGDATIYAELAAAGVDVIATDLHWTAYDALEAAGQDTAGAVAACAAPPRTVGLRP